MMKIKLYENWNVIARKAWSCRLMILAGLLSGTEVVLPMFEESIPKGLFAVLSMVAMTSAFVARLVAQQEVDDDAK